MTALPEYPNEVVTKALVRLVKVPGLDKPAALITLDNGLDYKKPNSFGPAGLRSLDEAITKATEADPAFIALTGKPYIFCVGADITGMPFITQREQAVALGELGHRVFARLKNSAIPTFAFINGAALGGGLEVSLHCHYRTVSGGAAALGLPEVAIGLIPGWGGSQLLPNLIGVPGAAQVILQNPLTRKVLRPTQAAELGVADRVHFLGHRADVPALYGRATLGVLCSTAEGMSNAVMEGMAAGLPMVVTRVGGNPELVADGERGLVVPPLRPQALSEAFGVLLADRERGRRMGAEARAFVERELSLERLVRRHDVLYRRVARGG